MEAYPIADMPDHDERRQLGSLSWLECLPSSSMRCRVSVAATPTGERRAPKRGEWFLSGAIVTAYKAPNDLSTPYRIARLVRVERIEKVVFTPIKTNRKETK
jgi:hypothetical protein